jgi:uncharacterized protein
MHLVDDAPAFGWLTGPPAPAAHTWSGGTLTLSAGPRTDWFVDPTGAHDLVGDAPILLAPAGDRPVSLAASAAMDGTSRYDAAALYACAGPRSWAKLALERNPLGELTLVSVVTDGSSDDCNHRVAASAEVRLRVTAVGGGAFAFHAEEGGRWDLLRLFALGDAKAEPDSVRLGLSAQSPLGGGCTATFRGLRWSTSVPTDLRDGT